VLSGEDERIGLCSGGIRPASQARKFTLPPPTPPSCSQVSLRSLVDAKMQEAPQQQQQQPPTDWVAALLGSASWADAIRDLHDGGGIVQADALEYLEVGWESDSRFVVACYVYVCCGCCSYCTTRASPFGSSSTSPSLWFLQFRSVDAAEAVHPLPVRASLYISALGLFVETKPEAADQPFTLWLEWTQLSSFVFKGVTMAVARLDGCHFSFVFGDEGTAKTARDAILHLHPASVLVADRVLKVTPPPLDTAYQPMWFSFPAPFCASTCRDPLLEARKAAARARLPRVPLESTLTSLSRKTRPALQRPFSPTCVSVQKLC
jgi:hypothetical protein